MSRPLAFVNATLVCPQSGVASGGLLVRDGAIAATGTIEIPTDAETID
jgi:dihydroorotase